MLAGQAAEDPEHGKAGAHEEQQGQAKLTRDTCAIYTRNPLHNFMNSNTSRSVHGEKGSGACATPHRHLCICAFVRQILQDKPSLKQRHPQAKKTWSQTKPYASLYRLLPGILWGSHTCGKQEHRLANTTGIPKPTRLISGRGRA